MKDVPVRHRKPLLVIRLADEKVDNKGTLRMRQGLFAGLGSLLGLLLVGAGVYGFVRYQRLHPKVKATIKQLPPYELPDSEVKIKMRKLSFSAKSLAELEDDREKLIVG